MKKSKKVLATSKVSEDAKTNVEALTKDNNKDAEKNPDDEPSTSNAGGESSSRRAVPERKLTSQQLQGGQKPMFSNAGGASSSRAVLSFTYEELQKATENFQFLDFNGEGGFGRVYRGNLPINHNKRIAIKKRCHVTEEGQRQFNAEVSILGRADHPNIVEFSGYCAEGDHHRLLVYHYMPPGSLGTHLQRGFRREALDWNRKKKISAQAAMGLQYLHQGLKPPVIFDEVKCSNILFGPRYAMKMTDFGLAREGPVLIFDANSRLMGTYGFCDPGYVETGVLTLKPDVYSFGVALLELFTERGPILVSTAATCVNLAEWAAALFNDRTLRTQLSLLQDHYPESEMPEALTIDTSCVQPEAEKWPNAAPLFELLTSHWMQKLCSDGRPKHRRTCSLPPGIYSRDLGNKVKVTEVPEDNNDAEDPSSTSNTVSKPEVSLLENIPEAVLCACILFKLPVKDLGSLKKVSFYWEKLISSREFIEDQMRFSMPQPSRYVLFGMKSKFILLEVSNHQLQQPKALGYCPPIKNPASAFEIVGVSDGLICIKSSYDCFWNFLEDDGGSVFLVFNPALEEFVEITNPIPDTYAVDTWFGKTSSSFPDYQIISRFRFSAAAVLFSGFFTYSLRDKVWSVSALLDSEFTWFHKLSKLTTVFNDCLFLSLTRYSRWKKKKIIALDLVNNRSKEYRWIDWLDDYNDIEFYVTDNLLCLHCCCWDSKSDFWCQMDSNDWQSWQHICTMDWQGDILATDFRGSFLIGCLERSNKEAYDIWPGDDGQSVELEEEYTLSQGCGLYVETPVSPHL